MDAEQFEQPRRLPTLDDEAAALAWFAHMRENQPVWADETGIWHVFGHEDVVGVLRDPQRFSSDLTWALGGESPGGNLAVDPPGHDRLRSLVSSTFTPRRIADLEPRIREITRELLDAAGDRFDAISEVADELPLRVISELLGLDDGERLRVRGWIDAMGEADVGDPFSDAESMERGMNVFPVFVAMLVEVCADRRAHPRGDLISGLVTSEVDGETLSDQDAGAFSMGLFIAGHGTTTGWMGSTLRTLDERPGLWDVLHRDPERIPPLLEEVLRLRPPAPRLHRVTTEDVELGGVAIPAKKIVNLWLVSANHDPRTFREPDVVDLDRGVRGAGQLSFGSGSHFCLGAALARREVRILLEEVLERYGRLVVERDPAQPFDGLAPYAHTALGVRRLPVHPA